MSQSPNSARKPTVIKTLLNWPLVRKIESIVFLAMFLAMPLFAFRVIDYTARQMALQNAAHDLVKDIRRARAMAGADNVDVAVEAIKGEYEKTGRYVIRDGEHIKEDVQLPKGVSILGAVTFHPNGMPTSAATFEVHNDTHSITIDVDLQGSVTMP